MTSAGGCGHTLPVEILVADLGNDAGALAVVDW